MNILLSILVLWAALIIHEMGHYLAMRAFGMPVENFTIGLGPSVTLFRLQGVPFRLAPLPLGAYVMPTNHEGEYTGRPVYQRLIVSAAGPIMSFLGGLVALYILMVFYKDESLWAAIGHSFILLGVVFEKMFAFLTHHSGELYAKSSVTGNFTFVEKASWPMVTASIAAVSLSLGFFNLIPVPPLDGGRIVLELYELVTRRKPHEYVQVALTLCGVAFVLSLWLAGAYHDIIGINQ